jgi:hypothetical protein
MGSISSARLIATQRKRENKKDKARMCDVETEHVQSGDTNTCDLETVQSEDSPDGYLIRVTIGARPCRRSTVINPTASNSASARRFASRLIPYLFSIPLGKEKVELLTRHAIWCSSIQTSAFGVLVALFAACPFRKLNPTVLMVKSAEDVVSDDAAAALNGSAMWGIFLQTEMGPCRVVIRSVFLQDAAKMGLAPHDHVVKTLPLNFR